jgi:hypothetical protein
LIVPDTITLLHLPASSPELNPMELVWYCLRQNKLANRGVPDLSADHGCVLHCLEILRQRRRYRYFHHDTRVGTGQNLAITGIICSICATIAAVERHSWTSVAGFAEETVHSPIGFTGLALVTTRRWVASRPGKAASSIAARTASRSAVPSIP